MRKYKLQIIIIFLVLCIGIYFYINKKIDDKNNELLVHTNLKKNIKEHYSTYVKTNKKTDLYILNKDIYVKIGEIEKNIELTLDEQNIKYSNLYFKTTSFNNDYYIFYQDVDKVDNISQNNNRYKKYIPYNKNIITKDRITLYDEYNNELFTIPEKLNTPIIINKEDFYGIEYNNRLLYIKNNDIEEIKTNINTDKSNTTGIAVLNYHFFYDANDPNDSCNQGICLSTQMLKTHL